MEIRESEFANATAGRRDRANPKSQISDPVAAPCRHQAARRSDSVNDSMLAALGLTSQNLPM